MIDSFRGHYRFLSNYYYATQVINGVTYPTNEHFFQACKTLVPEEQFAIIAAPSPTVAKRMGSPKGYVMPDGTLFKIVVRSDWPLISIGIMRIGIDAKFGQNIPLHNELILTHPHRLCEGNYWHDNLWGDCKCPRCLDIQGLNLLGQLQMAYRAQYV